jgi:hypothetical protein
MLRVAEALVNEIDKFPLLDGPRSAAAKKKLSEPAASRAPLGHHCCMAGRDGMPLVLVDVMQELVDLGHVPVLPDALERLDHLVRRDRAVAVLVEERPHPVRKVLRVHALLRRVVRLPTPATLTARDAGRRRTCSCIAERAASNAFAETPGVWRETPNGLGAWRTMITVANSLKSTSPEPSASIRLKRRSTCAPRALRKPCVCGL